MADEPSLMNPEAFVAAVEAVVGVRQCPNCAHLADALQQAMGERDALRSVMESSANAIDSIVRRPMAAEAALLGITPLLQSFVMGLAYADRDDGMMTVTVSEDFVAMFESWRESSSEVREALMEMFVLAKSDLRSSSDPERHELYERLVALGIV